MSHVGDVASLSSVSFNIDEDMNAMYLTDKVAGVERDTHEHEEIEILLESFAKQVEEIVNEAETIEVG